jgi:hypothetical protein
MILHQNNMNMSRPFRLRPYQKKAVAAVVSGYREKNQRRMLLYLPTGAGKDHDCQPYHLHESMKQLLPETMSDREGSDSERVSNAGVNVSVSSSVNCASASRLDATWSQ